MSYIHEDKPPVIREQINTSYSYDFLYSDKDNKIKELELEIDLLKIQINELKIRILTPPTIKTDWVPPLVTPCPSPVYPDPNSPWVSINTTPANFIWCENEKSGV